MSGNARQTPNAAGASYFSFCCIPCHSPRSLNENPPTRPPARRRAHPPPWCVVCCWVEQVFADALTLGLMCYASFLEPDDDDDSDTLELVYAGALLVQVSRPPRARFLTVLGSAALQQERSGCLCWQHRIAVVLFVCVVLTSPVLLV